MPRGYHKNISEFEAPASQEPKEETTPSVQERPPVVPQQSQSSTVTHVLTDSESHLVKLANADAFDWDKAAQAISILDDYSILQDPMQIPDSCKARHANKEFRYRWLDPNNKEKFSMQTSGPFRWVLCTRNNAPYIPDEERDENGLVRRSGLVLACMRYDLYMARQTHIWKLSESQATPKQGPAKVEGHEYLPESESRIRAKDIVVSSEHYDERTGRAGFYEVNRPAGSDRDLD